MWEVSFEDGGKDDMDWYELLQARAHRRETEDRLAVLEEDPGLGRGLEAVARSGPLDLHLLEGQALLRIGEPGSKIREQPAERQDEEKGALAAGKTAAKSEKNAFARINFSEPMVGSFMSCTDGSLFFLLCS